jgi:hypothetical protein
MKQLAVAVLVLAAVGLALDAGHAQGGITVRSNTASSDFPDGLQFELNAAANNEFDDVRLIYEIAPDGVRASAIPECTPGSDITCSYQLAGSQRDVIIPGAEVTYSWRMTSGDETHETPPQKIVYEDSRFDWQTMSEGDLTVWYYGSEDQARAVLGAAGESLQRGSELLQTEIDFPVKLFLYDTAEEMQPAILASNEEGVVTRGEVVYSDTAMVSADYAPEEIARHEIMHVVQRAALSGAYYEPDWLSEGLAVYAQSEPLSGQRQAIESAIESGDILSVRSMSSSTSGALSGNVLLFYGESWSLVKFLVDEFGEAKMADFYRAFDAGAGTSGALEQVYGFNQDGFENSWRGSVGLPPRQAPTPEDRANASEPTVDSSNASAAETEDDGSNLVLIAGVIAGTVVIAGTLLTMGVILARRYS